MKRMRKNVSSCVLYAFLFYQEGKQETVLNIKNIELDENSSFIKQNEIASKFIEIPENSRFCGQQRITKQNVAQTENFFMHSSKATKHKK